MKRIFLISFLILFSSCKYTESPSLALAKEMCSCLFIAEQSESYCKMVTKESRILARYEIFENSRTVAARAFSYRATAMLNDDPRFGCQLVDVEKLLKDDFDSEFEE